MKKYFITGLLIWIPLAITIWVLKLVVDVLDQSLLLLPDRLHTENWLGFHVPGLGAILTLAQFGTTTIAGQSLTNLNVIAAVVIGGTSIFGGEGSIFGTVVGLFIPAVLQSGFVIIGVQPFWQGVAVGTVLIAAVYVDQSRRAAAQRGARSRSFIKRSKSQRKERQ